MVQRTALRRVDPSTGTSSESLLNQSVAEGRPETYTYLGGRISKTTCQTLQRTAQFVRLSLGL